MSRCILHRSRVETDPIPEGSTRGYTVLRVCGAQKNEPRISDVCRHRTRSRLVGFAMEERVPRGQMQSASGLCRLVVVIWGSPSFVLQSSICECFCCLETLALA